MQLLGERARPLDLLKISASALTPRRPSRRTHHCSFRCSATDDDEAMPLMGDWRAFRAKLVAESSDSAGWTARRTEPNLRILREQNPALAQEEMWAHSTAAPEQGGLLVATTAGQEVLPPEYWQAVVLLADYSAPGEAKDPNRATIGFMLNRPTGLTMAKAPLSGGGSRSALCSTFPFNRLYCGGLAAQQIVSLMHGFKDLEGAKRQVLSIAMCFERPFPSIAPLPAP